MRDNRDYEISGDGPRKRRGVPCTAGDAKAYTKLWTAKMTRIMLDAELIEVVCNENEISVTHVVGK